MGGYKAVLAEPKRAPVKPVVNHGRVDVSHVQAKFHTAMAVIAERSEVRVGDRVFVKEVTPDKGCKGTVRFLGSVDFVDDMSEWLGIELDQQIGRHDGTVQGVRYFSAGKDRGVFVTMNKVVKLDSDENYNESCDVSLCESSLSTMSPAPPSHTRSYSATPTNRVRRSLSLRHHENKSATPSMTGSMNSKAPSNFSRSYSVRQRSDSNERTMHKFKKKLDKKYLEVGQGVMCIHNREMAVVKYVGH